MMWNTGILLFRHIFFQKKFAGKGINTTFAIPNDTNLIGKRKWPVRLGVRTGDFHSSNRGSIPLRATESFTEM